MDMADIVLVVYSQTSFYFLSLNLVMMFEYLYNTPEYVK